VTAVPFILGQPQERDIIYDLVEILSDERSVRTEEIKREKLMSMACKKAVKAGDKLSQDELSALVGIIAAEDIPLTCPHGRPFVIVLNRHSMEKQFRRTK
jgi:DNA mismatch repair protein MutL